MNCLCVFFFSQSTNEWIHFTFLLWLINENIKNPDSKKKFCLSIRCILGIYFWLILSVMFSDRNSVIQTNKHTHTKFFVVENIISVKWNEIKVKHSNNNNKKANLSVQSGVKFSHSFLVHFHHHVFSILLFDQKFFFWSKHLRSIDFNWG